MRYIDPQIKALAIQLIRQAEDAFNVKVVHAALAPHSGDRREKFNGEEFSLQLAFTRDVRTYHEPRPPLPISNSYERPPNSPISIMGMDMRDAFTAAAENHEMLAAAAIAPYLNVHSAESIVRNDVMDTMAPRLAAAGANMRASLTRALDASIDVATRFAHGELPAKLVSTSSNSNFSAQQQPATYFGGAATPAVDLREQSRSLAIYARGFAALAAKAHLATGSLPQADELDWPQALREQFRDLPSLRDIVGVPAHSKRETLTEATNMVSQFVPTQMGALHNFGTAFGGARVAPPTETPAQILAIVCEGFAETVENSRKLTERATPEDLVNNVMRPSGLAPIDGAPAPAPTPQTSAFRIPAPAQQQPGETMR